LINGLNVTNGACNASGQFYVTINFDHTGTSTKFKIQGNGKNYGLFSYSELPVAIGPLKADCITNYEFVVRDEINQDCFAFKNLGKKCCEDNCSINFENVESGPCMNDKYQLFFDLDYNAPDNGFDLYNNGQFYGYYQYSQLPLNLMDFPTSPFETYNEIVVCANDNPTCCDTLKILNPCVCSIYNVQGQVVNCNEEAGKFSLRLNFKHNLTSDSFQVGGSSINFGKFAYADLPITLPNISFSDNIEYEFLIVDKNNAFCFGSYELGKVTKCNFECSITDLVVKPRPCVDSIFYVDISFKNRNTGLNGFRIRGNGVVYGEYEYGETSYKVGPLLANCETLYEFVVRDKEMEGCSAVASFTEPVCCEMSCELSALTITEACENGVLKAININFNHTETSGTFVLKINSTVIGTYAYGVLPLKITNFNFDGPNLLVKIFDSEDESCHLLKEYKLLCGSENACKIYDLSVLPTECNAQGKFYAKLKFKVSDPKADRFILKVNGIVYDTLAYGKEFYEIGPFNGDCSTLYKFLVQDIMNSACKDDYSFTEKVCCNNECKISDPLVSFSACEQGKFDLRINFSHVNTLLKFRVKLNGVIKGPFNYSDLPVIIENLNEKQSYEIIIWDVEKEACRLSLNIPAIECTSGTDDTWSSNFIMSNDDHTVLLSIGEKWLPSSISISNLSGHQLLSTSGNAENSIDISVLPRGLYFLQIRHEKQVITRKFVKY
jgi:hypothetical protein